MPTAPPGGFQQGGWYDGKQYWNGSFSDPGVIHSESDQIGAGQAVSAEVNRQSDAAQGLAPGTIDNYLQQQRQQQQQQQPTAPVASTPSYAPTQIDTGEIPGLAGSGTGINTTQTQFNLPELYKGLQESSGISAIEADLSEKEKQFTEAKGVINDNPWLSEATRVGRVAKIEKLFAERTANLRSDVATKKADIETQLNLEMQQFDINSQQSQLAWQQFSTLLDMGALDNAGGEAIASITRSTGISSDMIKSAISERNKPEPVQTSIIQSEDDNGVVTVSVINSETGAIISQQNLGAIGTKTKVASGSGSSSVSSTKNVEARFVEDASTLSGADVGVFVQLVAEYAPYMSLEEIYTNYLNTDIGRAYGSPKESASEIKEVYDHYRGA